MTENGTCSWWTRRTGWGHPREEQDPHPPHPCLPLGCLCRSSVSLWPPLPLDGERVRDLGLLELLTPTEALRWLCGDTHTLRPGPRTGSTHLSPVPVWGWGSSPPCWAGLEGPTGTRCFRCWPAGAGGNAGREEEECGCSPSSWEHTLATPRRTLKKGGGTSLRGEMLRRFWTTGKTNNGGDGVTQTLTHVGIFVVFDDLPQFKIPRHDR